MTQHTNKWTIEFLVAFTNGSWRKQTRFMHFPLYVTEEAATRVLEDSIEIQYAVERHEIEEQLDKLKHAEVSLEFQRDDLDMTADFGDERWEQIREDEQVLQASIEHLNAEYQRVNIAHIAVISTQVEYVEGEDR